MNSYQANLFNINQEIFDNINTLLKTDQSDHLEIEINEQLEKISKITEEALNNFESIHHFDDQTQIKYLINYQKLLKKIDKLTTRYENNKKIISKTKLAAYQIWRVSNQIEKHIHRHYKMPINYGNELINIRQSISNHLLLPTDELISEQFQQEAFHFFADQVSPDCLKDLNKARLNGNFFLFSFYSFLTILVKLTKSFNDPELVKFVKDIKKTTILAEKKYIIKMLIKHHWKDARDYYTSVLTLCSNPEKTSDSDLLKNFSLSYSVENLETLSLVPLSVFIQDFTLDILSQIEKLKTGDRAFFPLGLPNHLILIEVTKNQEDDYTYTIFNTGKGSEYHSLTMTDQLYAKPITITNLSLKSFSYDFISDLVEASFIERLEPKQWYDIHYNHFVEQHEGTWHLDKGAFYLIQTHGTCSYLSLVANFLSHFSHFTQHFKCIEASIAIAKQKTVISNFNQKIDQLEEAKLHSTEHVPLKIRKYQANPFTRRSQDEMIEKYSQIINQSSILLKIAQEQFDKFYSILDVSNLSVYQTLIN